MAAGQIVISRSNAEAGQIEHGQQLRVGRLIEQRIVRPHHQIIQHHRCPDITQQSGTSGGPQHGEASANLGESALIAHQRGPQHLAECLVKPARLTGQGGTHNSSADSRTSRRAFQPLPSTNGAPPTSAPGPCTSSYMPSVACHCRALRSTIHSPAGACPAAMSNKLRSAAWPRPAAPNASHIAGSK